MCGLQSNKIPLRTECVCLKPVPKTHDQTLHKVTIIILIKTWDFFFIRYLFGPHFGGWTIFSWILNYCSAINFYRKETFTNIDSRQLGGATKKPRSRGLVPKNMNVVIIDPTNLINVIMGLWNGIWNTECLVKKIFPSPAGFFSLFLSGPLNWR